MKILIIEDEKELSDSIVSYLSSEKYLCEQAFDFADAKIRIYAIIRRREFKATNTIESNGISINLLDKSVKVNDEDVVLTKSEYELLLFLIGNKNRVISKSAMAEHLSGELADMMDNFDFVYTHIKNLKLKLAHAGSKDCIKNVYGTGYKWVP